MSTRLSAVLLSLFAVLAFAAGARALSDAAPRTAPAPAGQASEAAAITAAPTITSVSPSAITAGEAVTFVITGADFTPASTAKLGTVSLAIEGQDDNTITATLAANAVTKTTPSSLNVVVNTPGGGGGNSNAVPVTILPAAAASVALTPAGPSVVAGGTQAFAATVFDAFNNPRPSDSVTWTAGVSITFNATGALNATAQPPTVAGVYIPAVSVQVRNTPLTIQASAGLTVTAGAVAVVQVSPSNATLVSGGTRTFNAVARDAFGNAVTGATFNWSGSGGSFSPPSGSTTTYTAPGPVGNYTVQATSASVQDTAAVTVTPGAIASIVITPSAVSLPAGAQQGYVASAYDAAGNVVSTPFTWTAVGANGSFNIGTPTASPVIYTAPTTVGSYTVRASASSVNRTASVTVTPGPIATIAVSPGSASLAPGENTAFSAVARDQYGNVITTPNFVWTATGGTVAPTSATPNPIAYTAPNTAGGYTVRATNGGISGTASVTVNPGTLAAITLTPANSSVAVLGTVTYTAVGRDGFGNVISGLPFVWTAGPGVTLNSPPVGSASAIATAGTLAGGFTNAITVSVGGIRDRANVTVTPGPLFRIDVNPTGATLAPNATQVFTAAGFDQYNNILPGLTFNWQQASFSGNFPGSYVGSTTGSSATYRAGTTAGSYPGAIRVVRVGSSVVGTANIAITSAALARIAISPASATLPVNGLQTFTAIGYDTFDNPIPDLAVGWTTSAGVLVSQGPTTATLRAAGSVGTYANGIEATTGALSSAAQVVIQPGAIASVRVTPNQQTLQVGASAVFAAEALDASNNVIPNVSFTWSTPGNAGSIQSSGATNATFKAGNAAGTFANAIAATAGGKTGGAEVVVTPGALANLSISPANITVLAGGTAQFSVAGSDAFGNAIGGIAPVWSVTPGAGTIQPNGLFTAGSAPGAYANAITATSNGVTARANVTVSTATLSTIVISPSVTSMAAGSARLFSAVGRDQFGNDIPGLPFTWSAPEGGVIESSTPFTAVFRAGSAQGLFPNAVRAQSGAVARTASVLVTQLDLTLSATPNTLVTNGASVVQINALAKDGQGVPVGAGALVTITVNGCPGSCALNTLNPLGAAALSVSGLTDANGVFAAQLRSTFTSVTGTLLSQITLAASASTRAISAQASAVVPGRFDPLLLRLPLTFRDYRQPVTGNQLTCNAYPIAIPGDVAQRATSENNQYRFNAPAAGAVTLSVRGFPSTGTLYVYRVDENKCPASIRLARTPDLVATLGAGNFAQRLGGLTPGAQYIAWIVINANGLSQQIYTVRLDP